VKLCHHTLQAYEEIMENMSPEEATYEELSKMEYLDWAIQESMRIYPAAPRLVLLLQYVWVCIT